jgi:4-amino-4-deoxy-L-arabinose transferase-like glycosyltransferase
MMQRHNYVTPYINGIRFFDKPPLMYWMAAASMHVFGIYDWAARLPLALAVLALLLAVYALGIRLFSAISPIKNPDRAAFYAALALATSIGPYLYTRFYIPDILLALWMTLAVHLFLIAMDRLNSAERQSPGALSFAHLAKGGNVKSSALLPCLAFAAVMALNVLTKGLIGLVFPIAFVFLYLALTKQLPLLRKFHLLASTAVFLVIAAPWHILAAIRNPAIALPSGLGLPAQGGWAWFYLYNEHIARFLSKRIPHDYGLTPVWLFWLYLALWIFPWAIFLPTAAAEQIRTLRSRATTREPSSLSPHSSPSSADTWPSPPPNPHPAPTSSHSSPWPAAPKPTISPSATSSISPEPPWASSAAPSPPPPSAWSASASAAISCAATDEPTQLISPSPPSWP